MMEIGEVKEAITKKLSDLASENLRLKADCEKLNKRNETILDEALIEFLNVLDTFERAEDYIQKQELDKDESASKAIRRLLNAKKKALFVLEKYNVTKMEFENNISVPEWCSVSDTEPDSSKQNGEIVSIEKNGYLRDGRLLRSAEVVIVKNKN